MSSPSTSASRWCTWWAKALGFVPITAVVALVLIGYLTTLPQVDESSSTPTVDRSADLMVALGDSFIAGEGAGRYLRGTSTEANTCHRANTAYPFLVARELGFRLVAAACSGALTSHVTSTAQHPESPPDVYGGQRQIAHMTSSDIHDSADEIKVLILSIGGNDAGFSDIVKTCLESNCIDDTGEWMNKLEENVPRKLYDTYRTVGDLAPSARKIVVPYPDLIAPGSCLGNRLTAAEVAWVRQKFLPRLDQIISFEAANAGWEVADDVHVFDGARICEPGVRIEDQAANILKVDQLAKETRINAGEWVRGSFHPNPLGHQLLAATLSQTLTTTQPPPDLQTNACPDFDSCPPPPPNPDVFPPGATQPFPADAPRDRCGGDELSSQDVVTVEDQRSYDLHAAPGSTYCYREWAAEKWQSGKASAAGVVALSTTHLADQKTLSIEVLTRRSDATWQRTVLNATPHRQLDGESAVRRLALVAKWVTITIVGAALLVIPAPFLMCRRAKHQATAAAAASAGAGAEGGGG